MSNQKWYRGKMNLFKWVFVPALLAVWVVSCKKREIEKLNPEQNNALLAKLHAWNEANPATYKLPEAFLRAGSKSTENPDTPQPFYLDFDNLKTFASEDGKQILVIPVLRELKVDYTEEVAFVRRAVLEVDAEGNVLKSAVIEIVAEMATLRNTDRKDEIIRDIFRGENTDPALYYAITYDFNYNLIAGKTYQNGVISGDIEPVEFINTDYQRSITQKCGKTMVLMQVAYPCPGAPTAPINGGNGGDGNGGNSDDGGGDAAPTQDNGGRVVAGQKYASKLTCFTYVWATVDGEPCDTNTGNGVDPGTTTGAPGTPTPTTPTNPTPTNPTPTNPTPTNPPKDINWDDLDPGDNTTPTRDKTPAFRVKGKSADIQELINLMDKATGNTYAYDSKQGIITRTSQTLNTTTDKDKSGDLSQLIEDIITGKKQFFEAKLVNNDNDILFDNFPTAVIDLDDLKKAPDNAFLAGILMHIFSERIHVPNGGYKLKSTKEDIKIYERAHFLALISEGRVVGKMLGIDVNERVDKVVESITDKDGYTHEKIQYVYGNVAYEFKKIYKLKITTDSNGKIIEYLKAGDGKIVGSIIKTTK